MRINILFISCCLCISCASSKNNIDFSEVQNGRLLEKATDIELPDFITLYIENTHNPKVDFNLNQLFRDSNYTYFGRTTFKDRVFYRIKNIELVVVDYESIVGDDIRRKFIIDVIPQADKTKVQKGSKGCSFESISYDFKYKLLLPENAIEIRCHWKETCDFIKLIDKKYISKYSISKKEYYQ